MFLLICGCSEDVDHGKYCSLAEQVITKMIPTTATTVLSPYYYGLRPLHIHNGYE